MPTDKICFDRVLPRDLRRPHPARTIALDVGTARAAFQIAKLWPVATTLRIRFLGGTAQQHATVRQFAPQWTQHANLRFEFGDAADAQVRIAFADDGAWSYVGTDVLDIPSNQPTMNFGWLDQAVVLHEFGHCIGMAHEHQNPNANPIVWNKPVVNQALSGPPNFWDQPTIDHNMYAKYEASQINGSDFDRHSVMLYSFPASWTTNGFHSDPNGALSALDQEFAGRVYPRDAPGPLELPVIAHQDVEAEIGQAGEEDLFRFNATTAGRYTVETLGPTDLVMTLFGPDGQPLGQDDDGGSERNARLERLLTPGFHTVQVRHFNAAGGSGKYAIRVVRG